MQRILRPRMSWLGASLTEGIVVMVISTLFLSVLPGFHLAYVRIWQRESAKLGATQRADFALRRMQDDVRNARSVVVSSAGDSLTLVEPLRAYDATLNREVNVLTADDQLQDGDRISYYLAYSASSNTGATMYRRITHPDGTIESPRKVAAFLHPELNTLHSGSVLPLFGYDSAHRTLTVTVTAAEPKPSTGTFAPTAADLKCSRDRGHLVRVAVDGHPEGAVRCVYCGAQVRPTAELVSYQARLALRNG